MEVRGASGPPVLGSFGRVSSERFSLSRATARSIRLIGPSLFRSTVQRVAGDRSAEQRQVARRAGRERDQAQARAREFGCTRDVRDATEERQTGFARERSQVEEGGA